MEEKPKSGKTEKPKKGLSQIDDIRKQPTPRQTHIKIQTEFLNIFSEKN